jgi:hypothetical protein
MTRDIKDKLDVKFATMKIGEISSFINNEIFNNSEKTSIVRL